MAPVYLENVLIVKKIIHIIKTDCSLSLINNNDQLVSIEKK